MGGNIMREQYQELLDKHLTEDNAREYSKTMDKLIYCQDLTDLPLRSKWLERFEHEMWILACNMGLCDEND